MHNAVKYERRLSFSLLENQNATELHSMRYTVVVHYYIYASCCVYSCWNVLFVQQIKWWHFGILQFPTADDFGIRVNIYQLWMWSEANIQHNSICLGNIINSLSSVDLTCIYNKLYMNDVSLKPIHWTTELVKIAT